MRYQYLDLQFYRKNMMLIIYSTAQSCKNVLIGSTKVKYNRNGL